MSQLLSLHVDWGPLKGENWAGTSKVDCSVIYVADPPPPKREERKEIIIVMVGGFGQ